MYLQVIVVLFFINVINAKSVGLMLLYEPLDVTYLCAVSKNLQYHITFGMGMSDTITLVLRTNTPIDYKCVIEIESDVNTYIIFVIHFQNTFKTNCLYNRNAFVVLRGETCEFVCDVRNMSVYGKYYTVAMRDRVKFIFSSKSSVNADMDVSYYQVTVTSARRKPQTHKCIKSNETNCIVDKQDYCFTNGVVCDGIKNCGVTDWYDERKKNCGLPVEALGMAPVFTVVAAVCCALLAGGHILMKYLPPVANSFFIFNVNEDNRFNLDPQFKPPPTPFPRERIIKKKHSLIPISSSTSSAERHNSETTSEEVVSVKDMESSLHEEQQHTIFQKYSRILSTSKFFKLSQSRKRVLNV